MAFSYELWHVDPVIWHMLSKVTLTVYMEYTLSPRSILCLKERGANSHMLGR